MKKAAVLISGALAALTMLAALVVTVLGLGLRNSSAQSAPPPKTSTSGPPDAKRFVASVNEELRRLGVRSATAEWIKNTYITDDSERLAAAANEELLGYMSQAVKQAAGLRQRPGGSPTPAACCTCCGSARRWPPPATPSCGWS